MQHSVSIDTVIYAIKELRGKSDVLVLYGTPTKGNWLGIANATRELYLENAIEIPQSYSNLNINLIQEKELLNFVVTQNFDKIIISGFAPYFFNWIDFLCVSTKIEVLFHGTISEFHDQSRREFIAKLIAYGNQKKISKFGFVKIGLAEVFSKLYQLDCYHQPLKTPSIPKNISKLNLDSSKTHIGVFGGDTINKNLHNQVIHALLIDNSIVHVLDKSIFSYLNLDDRIVEHGSNLPKEKFLSILGSMDLNLYLSYSESWGLVAFESEAMGVPCVKTKHIDYLARIKKNLAAKEKSKQ